VGEDDEMTKAHIRTFECIVNVNGHLEGELKDWPSHIQDGIYAAQERCSKANSLPLVVVGSVCDWTPEDGHFIRVILSEVVAAPALHIPGDIKV
jgi:hypothetical protein